MKGGQTDLEQLLRSMEPELLDDVYAFCTIAPEQLSELAVQPTLLFGEREGMTAILPKAEAERAGLEYAFPSRRITLTVHSSLDAVGFLAAVTGALADADISVNAVSAFYHDHLFVPVHRAEEALQVLSALADAPAR